MMVLLLAIVMVMAAPVVTSAAVASVQVVKKSLGTHAVLKL